MNHTNWSRAVSQLSARFPNNARLNLAQVIAGRAAWAHFSMPPKRKTRTHADVPTRDASPVRTTKPPQTPLAALKAAILRRWPSLRIKAGHEEIENPESALSQVRNDALLTASEAGVLWNCKRGTSKLRWLELKKGLRVRVPVSEVGQNLMQLGIEREPHIVNAFHYTMNAEFHKIFPEDQVETHLPGPIVRLYPDDGFNIAATPDALLTWSVGEEAFCIPLEVKFFASKSYIPDQLPTDYLAQVLCQMICMRTRRALLIGEALTENGYQRRVWRLSASDELVRDFTTRLRDIHKLLAADSGTWPRRSPDEGARLQSMVEGSGDDCTLLWQWLLAEPTKLLRFSGGSLLLAGHS